MAKKTHFNTLEFEKAKKIANYDPISGIDAYEEYYRKYPRDYSGYSYYVSLLINFGQLDKAEKAIWYLEKAHQEERIFQNNENRSNTLMHHIIYCKLRLLCYQKKYNEAIILCRNNFHIIPDIKAEVYFYIRKQLGELDTERREPNSYLFRQIVEYHEDDFKDHIKKHLAEYNDNDRHYSISIFAPDFPIEKVLDEVKIYIPSDKKLCLGFMDNTYVFKYNECGRVNNKLVDCFKVTVFNGTSDIITICPSDECQYYPCIDLNYLKEKDDVKIKRISQIDKFNKRYNR